MKTQVSTNVAIALVVVVILVGGFFLYRAATAKEQGQMSKDSPQIKQMQELGKMMQPGNFGQPPKGVTTTK